MRSIKFRVWNLMSKKMMGWGEIFDLPAWEIFPGTPEQRAFNVMQYTGIKDENGTEIYEGDVCKRMVWAFGEIRTFTGQVKMFEGRWWIDTEGAAVPLWEETIRTIAVIGNVYENPELLRN